MGPSVLGPELWLHVYSFAPECVWRHLAVCRAFRDMLPACHFVCLDVHSGMSPPLLGKFISEQHQHADITFRDPAALSMALLALEGKLHRARKLDLGSLHGTFCWDLWQKANSLLSQCTGATDLTISLDLLDFPPATVRHGFQEDPLCAVTSLTSLTSLRRGPSPHSATRCGISQLIASNSRLVSLDLGGNGLSTEIISKMCREGLSSPQHSSLSRLNLQGNWVCNEGAISLIRVIANNHNLTHLSLRHCAIRVEGMVPLLWAMGESLRRLQRLDLSGNFLEAAGVEGLLAILKANPRVSQLELSYCDIKPQGARLLAHRLPDLPQVEELSIRGNNLGLSAVREVLRAVRRATAVTSLDLREIYDARHKDLTELVKDLRHVTCLDGIKMPPKRAAWKVGPTEIAGEHVAAFLANAALANKALTSLDLRGTRMCPDLLRSLQSALRHRPDIALHL